MSENLMRDWMLCTIFNHPKQDDLRFNDSSPKRYGQYLQNKRKRRGK